MSELVRMLVICWMVRDGQIVEQWRIDKLTSLPTCMSLNQTMSGGGKVAVVTVQCLKVTP